MNAIPPATAAVASLRARLWEAGFRPVALLTGEKKTLIRDWTTRARRDPPADAEDAPRSDYLNTGLLCDGLRVIDLDVDDAEIVARLRPLAAGLLGETVTRTRPGSPRCALLYRAAEGEPVKRVVVGTLGKIEVLGHGQQLHAFGRHPGGANLQWFPEAPGDATRDSLPAVTEEQITAFLAAGGVLIGAEPEAGGKARHRASQGADGPHAARNSDATADPLDVAAALAAIPNSGPADWEHWNNVAMATWAATGGAESGFAAWCAWSERHPTHDAAACRERWTHYVTSPPDKTGAGKLFKMATEACPGWRKPSSAGGAEDQAADPDLLANPDMTVLRMHRRPPPVLPRDAFGPEWRRWIEENAEAAACPPDYVAAPLLAAASALIGNARWAQATSGWAEPPHLWCASVGDSGSGKSPGADPLMRNVLPDIEGRMKGDFPDRLRDWRAAAAAHEAAAEAWKCGVRAAVKESRPPPPPPEEEAPAEPQAPRLRQSDVTIERVASLLANAAPKGLLVTRDELAGWLTGMTSYNEAGRAFWIEAYGGRPYRVERQKHPQPIEVRRLAVAVFGGTQPDKLAEMMREADDGLLARFCWFWPNATQFRLGRASSRAGWATDALDRLRLLEMLPGDAVGDPPQPGIVPLVTPALPSLEAFAQEMQERQQAAGGLMRSAYGKARGLALRLSLVIEFLWWGGRDGMAPPPFVISEAAFNAAAHLVADYLMPMAERVYGDAAARPEDRNAATLARWIVKTQAQEVHVRRLLREVRLPGLGDAEAIHTAAKVLAEAGWLVPPARGTFQRRAKAAYAVNPKVLDTAEGES